MIISGEFLLIEKNCTRHRKASDKSAAIWKITHRYDLVKRINTSNETIKLARDDYAA